MSLAAPLWAASADLAAVALDHPFVQGLGSGTLPRQAFSSYVAQDALFLDCFARAYALALVRAPDRETLEVFADLITGVRNELRLHASYAREWGADRPTAPLPATSAYTDFLLATAALGGVGQVCAVMTPCMRLYAHLGSRLSATGTGGPYGAWVRTYADQAFADLATSLERQLDRHATDDTVTAATYGVPWSSSWRSSTRRLTRGSSGPATAACRDYAQSSARLGRESGPSRRPTSRTLTGDNR